MTLMQLPPVPPAMVADKDFVPVPCPADAIRCRQTLNMGIFFDGTNNNRDRDLPHQSHSNVVSLWAAYKQDEEKGFFRFYVPGVGTPFKEVNENIELSGGKAKGEGGDARINWALMQVINSVHYYLFSQPWFSDADLLKHATRTLCGSGPTNRSNLKQDFFAQELSKPTKTSMGRLQPSLGDKIREAVKKKSIAAIELHVFGFSRGAAQARAFCHYLEHSLLDQGRLADIPVKVGFLGLFDTVCSVGLADSSPVGEGFAAWANGTQAIRAALVQRSVHMVAAHELRLAFPLSSAREGALYPPNCKEYVYPGVHSDVGGGYGPQEQGKAPTRQHLLSQVPLLQMYQEAREAGVPFLSTAQLRKTGAEQAADDLVVASKTVELFEAYRQATLGFAGDVDRLLQQHLACYWRFRARWKDRFNQLPSYAKAKRGLRDARGVSQEQVDLWEANHDFVREAHRVHQKDQSLRKAQEQRSAVAEFKTAFSQSSAEPLMDLFFDQCVHDSHAGFYMVGPVTDWDWRYRVAKVVERQKKLDALNARMDKPRPVRLHSFEQAIHDRVPATLRAQVPVDLDEARVNLSPSLIALVQQMQPQWFYPEPLTDKLTSALIDVESLSTKYALSYTQQGTRREAGGYGHYRMVFFTSKGVIT